MPFDYPAADATRPPPGSTKGEAVSLKEYAVTINGTETTLLLSDEDAKAQGLTESKPAADKPEKKAAPKPANKARKAPNKAK